MSLVFMLIKYLSFLILFSCYVELTTAGLKLHVF